jgi:protein-S-isoprenylcysteine O-methyltransferase Ste14
VSLEVQTLALAVAAVGTMVRFPAVAYAWVRTLLVRRRFVGFHFGWVELLTNFEPPLALICGFRLLQTVEGSFAPSPWRTFAAAIGASLVVVGWAFQICAFVSWTSLYAGHGVVEDQRLMTHGAYAVVRHPAYVGVCAIWLGLGVAFESPTVLATAGV